MFDDFYLIFRTLFLLISDAIDLTTQLQLSAWSSSTNQPLNVYWTSQKAFYWAKGSKNMPCVVPWQGLSVFLRRRCCGLVPRSRASVVHWATWAEAADDDGESRDDTGHDDGEGDDHGNPHVNFQHRVNNHVSAAPTIAVATLWKRLGFCAWFFLFTK